MSVTVTYNGASYAIPEQGETGWGDTTTNYLVALASSLSKTDVKFKTRTSNSTTISVTSQDTIIVCAAGSATTVTLPAGVTDKVYFVVDGTGFAATGNIRVETTGGQLIQDSAIYNIKQDYGFIGVCFNGTKWVPITTQNVYLRNEQQAYNNKNNASVVPAAITRVSNPATANNLEAMSITLGGSANIMLLISLSSGESIIVSTSYSRAEISCLQDIDGIFLEADAGTGIYVSKSAGSFVLNIKNRMGSAKAIEVKPLTNSVASTTVWS